MPISCVVGLHNWDGCKCRKCGKVRDEGHDWSKDCEKCARCGVTRQNSHNWKGCKCELCGKTRDQDHDWVKDCERCWKCGATRKDAHDWKADCEHCSRCSVTRSNTHQWDGCKCIKCGSFRDQDHDWSKDCERCSRCNVTRQNAHKWNGCTCVTCGKTREGGHDWWNKPGTCTICGQERPRINFNMSALGNSEAARQFTTRHACITKTLIVDSEQSTPVIIDLNTGKSTAMLPIGEFIEFTGFDKGINSIRTDNGWAVIHHAVNSNDIGLIQRVIDLKAELDVVDGKGWTPMHHAAWIGNGDIVRLLHKHGAPLNVLTYKDVLSPLHTAIAVDAPDAADALLACGADKEVKSKGDVRPLHLTAMKGRKEIAMLLLDYQAELDALEVNQSTALHAAAYYGHEGIVRILLAAGCAPGLSDLRGNTPLSLAKQGKHQAIVTLLSDKIAGDASQTDSGGSMTDDIVGMTAEQLLQQLEQFAREGLPIISNSKKEHFANIVEIMDFVGATRHGSQGQQGTDGRYYIFDNYTLPNGAKVKAGYEDKASRVSRATGHRLKVLHP
ncbi:MAG: ankyrin repeat domain-containing protein [Desulfobacterium sp.]|nr:ankyrin repeat domain-containing protein [Desulfobacterium sp.]MBU3946921.1 ankyrin repeat domain-containing protein [Pseudomonadota bacterium]MBU4037293.1 ankyrin repeat domain-containing protein [Pseudomonadota bacterium]